MSIMHGRADSRLAGLMLVAATLPTAAAQDEPASPAPELRLRLLSPFSPPRNSALFSGLGLPSLRHAAVMPEGVLTAKLRSSQTHTEDTADLDGQRSRMDAVYIEHARLDLELAVHERVALWTDLRIAGWDERRDVFRIRDEQGDLVIQGEEAKATLGRSTSRHENLAVVSFGALITAMRSEDGLSGLGASIAIKLPGFRRGDISNSGTADVALTLHGSLGIAERLVLHASAGLVAPLGQSWIFEDSDQFDAHTFLQAAVGASFAVTDWLSIGLTVEGATSTWEEDVAFLDRPALTVSGGARLLLGRFSIEIGAGAGLSSGSADWLAWVELGYVTRSLWGALPAAPAD
jgi:hypothetical protein